MDPNSKIKPFHKLNNINMLITEYKETTKNGKDKNRHESYLILPKTTYENRKKSVDKAVKVKNADFKRYVEKHKNELFPAGKTYTLSLLTEAGWRSGKRFNGNVFNYYDPRAWYEDKDDKVEYVFAVQVFVNG